MADNAKAAGVLLEVPAAQRDRIISGMRWTVWLSVFAIPFSYATTVILARTSPEAVGTYGLLGVYIGLNLGIFYLGGDAVAIKFIPELQPEKRPSFLVSYFLVICLAVLPWIAAGAIWPQGLQHLFGKEAGTSFELLLLILSPIPMMGSLVSAALKSVLDIGWAQLIYRLATISSFLVYGSFYFFSRSTLAQHYPLVIWGTYLTVCFGGAAGGFCRLWRVAGWNRYWRGIRFFLPRGFWAYTLALQQGSALSFFLGRLDVILLLNLGGLALLGKYVAVITLAGSIRLISGYFVGTLLPSLTNTLADGNKAGAAAVFHTHMRILFLVSAASTCGLILLAHPITSLLGPQYAGLAPLIVLVALLIGLCTPGGMGGTLLSSIGKQQRIVYVSLAQIAMYLFLFAWLWPRYRLAGAVLAYGISWVAGNLAGITVARLISPFPFSLTRDYVVLAVVAGAAALIAHFATLGLASGLGLWLVALALFLILGRYSLEECTALIHCFIPLARFSPERRAGAAVTNG
ncbi:MAG: lipopolysaccharide biosynthesis protein [Candidatus Acidiferrales bacterium]